MIQNQGEQDCSNCGFPVERGPTKELYITVDMADMLGSTDNNRIVEYKTK